MSAYGKRSLFVQCFIVANDLKSKGGKRDTLIKIFQIAFGVVAKPVLPIYHVLSLRTLISTCPHTNHIKAI